MRRHIPSRTIKLARLLADEDYNYLEDLRRIREENGLTPVDVAEKLGVSEKTIHDIEAPDANPSLNTLRQYALAVGARVTRLVENYETHEPESTPDQHRQHIRANYSLSYNPSEIGRVDTRKERKISFGDWDVSFKSKSNIDEGTAV